MSTSQANAARESNASFDPELYPVDFESWELDDELRDVERMIGGLNQQGRSNGQAEPQAVVQPAAPQPVDLPQLQHTRADGTSRTVKGRSGFFAWTLLALGLTILVSGGALIAWGFLVASGNLWQVGIPVTLVGLVMMLMGAVLQLDGLWENNRITNEVLSDLEKQIEQLQQTAALLTVTNSNSSQSFYMHMAGGANSQMLLADLKGQMDLLALKMSRENRAA